MTWNTTATQNATAILSDSGSMFGDLAEIDATRLKEVEIGKVYRLGRFEVIKSTKGQREPFVVLELNGAIFSGYGRAIANQLIGMTQGAASDPANKAFDNERKAWTELEVGLPVRFRNAQSEAGEYKVMEIGADENGEVKPETDKGTGKGKGKIKGNSDEPADAK